MLKTFLSSHRGRDELGLFQWKRVSNLTWGAKTYASVPKIAPPKRKPATKSPPPPPLRSLCLANKRRLWPMCEV